MKRLLLTVLMLPIRAIAGLRYLFHVAGLVSRWLFSSRESTNHTYDLTELNQRYLAHFLALVCDRSPETMAEYMRELTEDEELREHLIAWTSRSPRNFTADNEPRYARRIGWYAIVRAMRPAVVVETGVDKGLGSCVLTAALRRNEAEGAGGRYFGTDINPQAGYLFRAPFSQLGEILYGDSIESLKKLDETIDLFINDSDHSTAYEMDEFRTISGKLSATAIVIGDNSHFSPSLVDFAEASGRAFLYFQEQPAGHWYPGGGIGAAYPKRG